MNMCRYRWSRCFGSANVADTDGSDVPRTKRSPMPMLEDGEQEGEQSTNPQAVLAPVV